MTSRKPFFYPTKSIAIIALILGVMSDVSYGASVVSRTQRRNNASRMPTTTTTTTTTQATADTPIAKDEPIAQVTIDEPDEIIENKSSMFDDVLSEVSSLNTDGADNALSEQIRAQRAALDASSAATAVKESAKASSGKNACDGALRACMQAKCGSDFSKCAGDTDTTWGNKMDLCRRDTTCTGEEYRLFTTEIKADRDMNAEIASYNKIIECGNQYNNCIITECGTTFGKCLGKKSGDAAISKCDKVAKNCREQDSGLATRMMNVFGALRGDAEKSVQADEKRLYSIRDAMSSACKRLGAMFDERTLDCVYTVNFYAGQDNTLYASKKAYAGSTFNCDQNWFGVDTTTFMENAFRLTRSQTAASSAMLGSGVGMGVGAITSGAIDRAIDRHKADKAADKAEKEHNENYNEDSEEYCKKHNGKWDKKSKKCNYDDKTDKETDNKDNKKDTPPECKNNNGCDGNQQCKNKKCVALNCSDNQEAHNHKCVDKCADGQTRNEKGKCVDNQQDSSQGGGRNTPTDSSLTDHAREIAESNPDIAADATTDELNELAEEEDNFTPAWEQNMSETLQTDYENAVMRGEQTLRVPSITVPTQPNSYQIATIPTTTSKKGKKRTH